MPDGDQGHLFDIYEMPDLPDDPPVIVNIHGGGLFASFKEVNANFNYEWARLGYRTVSISYRRIPETTMWDTLKLDGLLAAVGTEHELLNFPKGGERQLIHVFSVSYPMYPESREVLTQMDAFFRAH